MNIKPLNYTILFEPALEKFTFEGEEIFTFEVTNETNEIELDSVDLEIKSVQLQNTDDKLTFVVDSKAKSLKINFANKLHKDIYKLKIAFKGIINQSLAGWYRSKYSADGKEKYIATTHFEAADARKAFPCIDHPAYKATFDISFKIDKNLTAVSNTLPIKETVKQNKKIVVFAQTPLMSTYLLYLGVGEFEWLEDKYNNILIRGITTPGKKEYTKFSIESAKKVLAYFEEYFDFKYPLSKVDLIAVPDFAAGAMENWGAITFRENLLLFYSDKSSIGTKQRIAEVVAHELAHQWFGNLVTMKWWDDLWLNESFATFMAYKAIDHYWPEWKLWSQYVMDTVFTGMSLDSLHTSHPIHAKVDSVEQIDELFDEIAYDKGGSILRMLEGYLGESVFRDGLRSYIKTFQYKNTAGNDLWSSLEKISKKPVSSLMKVFISQTGFPVVNFDLKNGQVSFSQKRFLFIDEADSSIWPIPLVIKDHEKEYRIMFDKKSDTLKLNEKSEYIRGNLNYTGFYVSNYSPDLLKSLGIHFSQLTDTEKLGTVHDLYYMVMNGQQQLAHFFNFLNEFTKIETDATVLMYIVSKLTSIYLLIEDDTAKKLLQYFAKKSLDFIQYEPQTGEDPSYSFLRSASLYGLSLLDDADVAIFSNKKFTAFLQDDKSLHPDIRGIIYSLAVWNDKNNYATVLDLYRRSQVQEESAKFLAALGNTKDKKLIQKTLELSLTDEVRFAHILYSLSAISRNPFAKDIVFDWLTIHWDELITKGGGMAHMILRRVLKMIIPSDAIGREKEAHAFLDKIYTESLKQTMDQIKEELAINSNFVKKNKSK